MLKNLEAGHLVAASGTTPTLKQFEAGHMVAASWTTTPSLKQVEAGDLVEVQVRNWDNAASWTTTSSLIKDLQPREIIGPVYNAPSGTTLPTLMEISRPLAIAIEQHTTTVWTGFLVVAVRFAVRHDRHDG
jgi:hypothetical protein